MTDPFMAPVLPDDLPDNPMDWAGSWLQEATRQEVQRNPNSMTLATADGDGLPSARVVLCKSFVADPGYVVFYTNYKSRKSDDIRARADVALTFHWDALGRQVRLEGLAVKSPAAESDAYFATRDWGSQLGAWGSDQSAVLASRKALRAQLRDRAREMGVPLSDDLQSIDGDARPEIERPPHWGGYRVWPARIELWIEGADRIHDRAVWTRTLSEKDNCTFDVTPWTGTRLQP